MSLSWVTLSSHLREVDGDAAAFFKMPEKVSGGRVDEEGGVASVSCVGGSGSDGGGCLEGVSCVEAVELGGGVRGGGAA